MNKKLKKMLDQNTISLDEFSKDFTDEQKQVSKNELRFYDVLISLKEAREKIGLTQEALAKKAQLPRTTITKIESGKYNPTISTLMNIASAMNKNILIRVV